jgi:hypothetical protein
MSDLFIPSDSEDITPEWLDQCFRRVGVIAGNNAVKSITPSESITNKGFMSQVICPSKNWLWRNLCGVRMTV